MCQIFRLIHKNAKVSDGLPMNWLSEEWISQGGVGKIPKFGPQDVIGILCKSMNQELGTFITPVEIDDQLMGLGGAVCTDDSPRCSACDLATSCQANIESTKVNLKSCYT